MKRSVIITAALVTILATGVYYVYSGQLKFDGVPVDITTADNEDLVIAPGTGGNTQIGDASGTNTNATSNDDIHITGKLETDGAAYFDSTLTTTGAATFNGAVTLGDATSDTLTATGRFGSGLVPSADSTYALGSSSLAFSNLYVDTISGYDAALSLSPASSYSLTGAVTKNTATGNEVAYDLAATINKATSGNYTGLKLNVTETLAPGSADKVLDLQVGGTSWLQLYNGANSANYGLLSLGSDDWDGSTSGYFTGSSSGTLIAGNVTSSFAGNLLDLQIAGSSKFKVDSSGNLTIAGTTTQSGDQTITGNIVPSTDSTYNLGSTSAAWSNLYADNLKTVSGTNLTLLPTSAYTIIGDAGSTSQSLSANDDLFVSGVLEVDGISYFDGNTNLGNASGDTLTINAATLSLANASTLNIADTSTTSLNIESGLLNLDTTNSRIGIGTTAPTAKLEILTAGTSASIGLRIRDNAGTDRVAMLDNGSVGIGTTLPTAVLHLKAGTATASTAPLKFTSGILLTTAEAGAIEFLTDAYYGTITTGAARKTFAFTDSAITGFTGTLAVGNGGTGVGSWTNGQLLIGNTTGNTAALATLTGTSNQITVTNGASSITLSAPQDIHTSATPQFARLGLGAAADATNILTATSASTTADSKSINVSHTGAITGIGYAGYFSKTGTSTTNIGLYATASGATNNYAAIFDAGRVGIGTTSPTAYLHLKAGTATASTAPLKFTSGTLLTTAEAGAIEFLTDAFYGTITTGAARKTFAFTDSAITGFTGTLAVGNGGTGVGSWTNGQLLIGNTTGNTAALATLTGTSNQITVTNGASSITLSAPQDIHTSATPQFARLGLGAAADATNILTATSASTTADSKSINVSHTGAITGIGYAGYFSKTGTSTTNIGLYATASGATNNYAAIFDAGSVGIGTTSPTAYLHLKAGTATASTAPLKLTSGTLLTTAEAGAIEFLTDAYYGTITTGAARKTFAFTDSDITGFTGTLAVGSGGTGATSFTSNGILYGNSTSAIQVTAQGGANTILTANAGAPAFSASPTIGTSVTTPLVIGGTATTSDLSLQTTSGVGASGADMHFLVGSNGGTEAMTILNSGYVGIGTTGPISLLTLRSPATVPQLYLEQANLGGGWKVGTNADDGHLHFISRQSSTDSERVTIQSGGNLGIGTTSPAAKLNIIGAGTGAGFGLLVEDSAGTDRVVILDNGNVGIGTTGPGSPLHVEGSANSFTGGFTLSNGLYKTQMYVDDTNQELHLRTDEGIMIYLNGAAAPSHIFKADGNVGINTTNPGSRLTVVGSGGDGNGGLRVQSAEGYYRQIYMAGATNSTLAFNDSVNTASLTNAGIWTDASDRAYKKDIKDMSKYGLETVMLMKPREYKMKSDLSPQIGFIAQEIEQIIPEVVSGEEGSKGLSYGQLTAVLTKAIQEQQSQIDDLKSRLAKVEGRL